MKDKFKIVIAALMLLGLAYLLPVRSDAGINNVKQSLGKNKIYNNGFKKDFAPTKPDNVAHLKKESKKPLAQTSFKPNIEFWKKQLKISQKKQVPKQALKPEKGQQLKRISEPLAQPPQRIKDTGFPDLSHNDNTEENEVKDAVSAIKNAVYGYDAETALNLMGQTHYLYSRFPKWAALVRFLLAELISRVILSVYDTKRVLDLESYRQIIDIYSSYKGTDSVYDYIISQSLDRLERWKPMQNQYEMGCVNAYKQIAERIQIINDLKKDRTVNEGPLADDTLNIEYSTLMTLYMVLTDTLLVLRDDESAYNSMHEMQEFFKNIPAQITINYEEYQNGNSWEPIIKKTKTYQVTKDTNRYLTSVKNYAQVFAILGGLDYRNEPSNYYKPEIINAVNEIKNYSITEHDNITPEILEGFKKELESYDKESEVSKIMFTTNECVEILPETIVEPTEIINVRCTIDNAGVIYARKVSIKSNVSKREKIFTLKSDMFYVGLFKNFVPNTNDNSNSENMIKKHGKDDKDLKNTVCISDGNPKYVFNPFAGIIQSKFFKDYTLGKGVTYNAVKNDETKISTGFLETLGFESITASLDKLEGNIKISNQADWFIAQGHSVQAIPEYCADLNKGEGYQLGVNFWLPTTLKNFKNTNLSFVIFGVCHIIQEPMIKPDDKVVLPSGYGTNGLKWQNLLGKTTALIGYSYTVHNSVCSPSMNNLIDSLSSLSLSYPYTNQDKINVINKWLEIHQKIYNDAVNQRNLAKTQMENDFSNTFLMDMYENAETQLPILKTARWASAIYYDDKDDKNYFYKLSENDYPASFFKIHNCQTEPPTGKETQIKAVRTEIFITIN